MRKIWIACFSSKTSEKSVHLEMYKLSFFALGVLVGMPERQSKKDKKKSFFFVKKGPQVNQSVEEWKMKQMWY